MGKGSRHKRQVDAIISFMREPKYACHELIPAVAYTVFEVKPIDITAETPVDDNSGHITRYTDRKVAFFARDLLNAEALLKLIEETQ